MFLSLRKAAEPQLFLEKLYQDDNQAQSKIKTLNLTLTPTDSEAFKKKKKKSVQKRLLWGKLFSAPERKLFEDTVQFFISLGSPTMQWKIRATALLNH